MRWKEDRLTWVFWGEWGKRVVPSRSDCGEGDALARSRDSLTRWLNSFKVSLRVLVMEGDGGRWERDGGSQTLAGEARVDCLKSQTQDATRFVDHDHDVHTKEPTQIWTCVSLWISTISLEDQRRRHIQTWSDIRTHLVSRGSSIARRGVARRVEKAPRSKKKLTTSTGYASLPTHTRKVFVSFPPSGGENFSPM